ncbi:MAG: hypothetical protein ABIR68_14295 [Ilumatobacteraceae bacterium]
MTDPTNEPEIDESEVVEPEIDEIDGSAEPEVDGVEAGEPEIGAMETDGPETADSEPAAQVVAAPVVPPAPDLPLAEQPGFAIVRFGIVGTVLFVVAMAIAVPLRTARSGQVLIAAASMLLFAAGVATSLWAYTSALERSRTAEVGVSNLFLLTGPTAPKPVRLTLWACLVVQIVVAIAGASIGIAGLDKDQLNALAFGVLVPMFGIGVNGIWAARHGSYGARQAPSVRPSNRKIG